MSTNPACLCYGCKEGGGHPYPEMTWWRCAKCLEDATPIYKFSIFVAFVAMALDAWTKDNNFGRSCLRCNRPVPAGCRYYHSNGACLK